jgi:ribose 5-phosphate isomerase B
MVANKVAGVRCAVCWNKLSARLAKEHNNANMIAIGARQASIDEAIKIVNTWLDAVFLGGRHVCRIEKMENLAKNSTNACNGRNP